MEQTGSFAAFHQPAQNRHNDKDPNRGEDGLESLVKAVPAGVVGYTVC